MRKQQISHMLAENPDDSFLLFAMAKEFEKENNFSDAVQYYDKLVEIDPEYVGVYYHLAHALIEIDAEESRIKTAFEKGSAIAEKINDSHALAELKNAFVNWEMSNL